MEDEILGDLTLRYQWPRAIAVTGALGSGKTEFVLNLARGLKQNGKNVTIADADIINPYFCIRQITKALEQEGFSILNPPETAKWSDMSVINPAIGNALIGSSDHIILDVGGDAGGVMALKQFEPAILSVGYRLLLIVNAWRPKTATPELIAAMASRMEDLCGLKVGALVSNSHMMEDTTLPDILDGLKVVLEAGQNMQLPVLYAAVETSRYTEAQSATESMMKENLATLEDPRAEGVAPGASGGMKQREVPLWPLIRFMKRPWEGSEMWS